tara:strand:+ start:120 stop:938 length:819 start_codon:yes stop_codon:yes gene_type:complete
MKKEIYLENSNDVYRDFSSRYVGKEHEFEAIVKENLGKILGKPKSKVFFFKLTLDPGTGESKVEADLLMIESDYKSFAIIEVETDNHPLRGHVLPQLRKLLKVDYAYRKHDILRHLKENNRNFKINEKKFIEMVNSINPDFYVISNKYNFSWDDALSRNDIKYLSISPYQNKLLKKTLHVKGIQEDYLYDTYKVIWDYDCFSVTDKSFSLFSIGEEVSVMYKHKNYLFIVEKCESGYDLFPTGSETIRRNHGKNELEKIRTVKYVNQRLEFK